MSVLKFLLIHEPKYSSDESNGMNSTPDSLSGTVAIISGCCKFEISAIKTLNTQVKKGARGKSLGMSNFSPADWVFQLPNSKVIAR